MKTSDHLSFVAQQFRFVSVHERSSRLLAVIICMCSLVLSSATWASTQDSVSKGVQHREVAVTFDDLPIISVTHLDTAARRNITRKLLNSIRSNKVPAIGFVNEYGIYGYQRDGTGAPDTDGIALLQ